MSKIVVEGLCYVRRHTPQQRLEQPFIEAVWLWFNVPFQRAPYFYHLVSISRRRGPSINCTCQLELGSQNAMAAQRPHTASPESAENYSTTCQFYCVVITKSHRQTFTIHCLLWWCGGVNSRSGEMSSSSFRQFNTQSCAFIARAGNCLSHCVA